jgi:hypothetical protein
MNQMIIKIRRHYGPESLLAEIIDNEIPIETPNRNEFVSALKEIVYKNFMVWLKDWISLSDRDKSKYPDGLKLMLEKVSNSLETKGN